MAIAAHVGGWPCAYGGSEAIAYAQTAEECAHGCEIRVGMKVRSLADVAQSRAVLFDGTGRRCTCVCGYWAALVALRRTFNKDVPEELAE